MSPESRNEVTQGSIILHAHNKLGQPRWRPRFLLFKRFAFLYSSIAANTLEDSNSRGIHNES